VSGDTAVAQSDPSVDATEHSVEVWTKKHSADIRKTAQCIHALI